MTIYNLGSINIDYAYYVPHLPAAGETLAADSMRMGLGGKGLNQSIAAARAGAQVIHIGAIGRADDWILAQMDRAGIDTNQVRKLEGPTGHAIINIDRSAENAIVLLAGANQQLTEDQIDQALAGASPGDWLLLQNETSLGQYGARLAGSKGMKICYSAAPFDLQAVQEILPYANLLVVNEHEAADIRRHLPEVAERFGAMTVVVTKGAKGAECVEQGKATSVDAFKVEAVDTTGAGDTFLGYFLARLDQGDGVKSSLTIASAASAIQVTREGAADAIPELSEVQEFVRVRVI